MEHLKKIVLLGALVVLQQTENAVGTMETLSNNLIAQLNEDMPLVDLVSYPGVNYECATAMIPMNSDPFTSPENAETVETLLEEGLSFPRPFYWVKRDFPVSWLYSPGDRISLFGALYRDVDPDVYCYVVDFSKEWPMHKGLFTRYVGYGPLLGLSPKRHIWADDIFIGGWVLLIDNPDMIKTMIDSAVEILKDPEDGLWWHGVHMVGDEYIPNGVKWGRAHGWILLMIAQYVTRTSGDYVEFLRDELNTTMAYQRSSGAFGNVVDEADSPDETSLTSVYVYAVGVLHKYTSGGAESVFLDSAQAAIDWLDDRKVTGFKWSESAAGMHLKEESEQYNSIVVEEATGPVVALSLWALVGKELIENPNATQYEPWLTPAPECPGELKYSGLFYFLSITGCITFILMIVGCCLKCSCCFLCRSKCCPCFERLCSKTNQDDDELETGKPLTVSPETDY